MGAGVSSAAERQGSGGPSGLQNRQGGAAPRLEGSIPSPLRGRDFPVATGFPGVRPVQADERSVAAQGRSRPLPATPGCHSTVTPRWVRPWTRLSEPSARIAEWWRVAAANLASVLAQHHRSRRMASCPLDLRPPIRTAMAMVGGRTHRPRCVSRGRRVGSGAAPVFPRPCRYRCCRGGLQRASLGCD
jgi:hypothetical protein